MRTLLTTKALADATGLSRKTIRRLERKGVIRAVRDFRGWRQFPPSEVARLRTLLGWDVLERDEECPASTALTAGSAHPHTDDSRRVERPARGERHD